MVEKTLVARNAQRDEVYRLGSAWGRVRMVLARRPQIRKAPIALEELRKAVPELFDQEYPWDPLPGFVVTDRLLAGHEFSKELATAVGCPVIGTMREVELAGPLVGPGRLIWEHGGKCQCGRRTYLFGQCEKCAKEEAAERRIAQEEQDLQSRRADQGSDVPPKVARVTGPEDEAEVTTVCVIQTDKPALVLVTPEMVRAAAWGEEDAPGAGALRKCSGVVHVQAWRAGTSLSLRVAKKTPKYRIILGVAEDDTVFVIQQCVAWTHEGPHECSGDRYPLSDKRCWVVVLCMDTWMLFDPVGDLSGSLRGRKLPNSGGSVAVLTQAVGRHTSRGPALGASRQEPLKRPPTIDPKYSIRDGRAELTEEGARWYENRSRYRAGLAEELRGDLGEHDFRTSATLRTSWGLAQREDPELCQLFRRGAVFPPDRRLSADSLVEKRISEPGTGAPIWVPIVPAGNATAVLTWRKWMLLQFHVGTMGMHRPPAKMRMMMTRVCWWPKMEEDLQRWADACLTCVRFRKRPRKQEQVAVKPVDVQGWEEVMVDLEGPSTPADATGQAYTMTYQCCLCHAVLLEPGSRLTAAEVRRMFARCTFRSGTIPLMLRTDRGPELKNAIMAGYTALVGLRHRFGTPWRPCGQGMVERVHQEVQRLMGILVKDVTRIRETEWTELLPAVEFVIYNTPGPHGFTPRDIDRRWSLAVPLEKELQPFQVAEFEPITDYARNLFAAYREVRAKAVGWYAASSQKRADLANRFRRSRVLTPGASVVYRGPRARAAGGRTPWKQPLTEPCRVTETHGNTCTLQRPDGTTIRDAHVEDVILGPDNATDWERNAPLLLEAPEMQETEGSRRSLGQMKESDPDPVLTRSGAGELDKLSVGQYVAYSAAQHPQEKQVRRCRMGRVHTISRPEDKIIIHRYKPVTDGRLRLRWVPAFVGEVGQESITPAKQPSLETVTARRILCVVQLHDGVLAHATARQLDKAGWRLDETDATHENEIAVLKEAVATFQLATSGPGAAGDESRQRPESADDSCGDPWQFCIEYEPATRLEELVATIRERPERALGWEGQTLQQWLQEGYVEFLEIYSGFSELTKSGE